MLTVPLCSGFCDGRRSFECQTSTPFEPSVLAIAGFQICESLPWWTQNQTQVHTRLSCLLCAVLAYCVGNILFCGLSCFTVIYGLLCFYCSLILDNERWRQADVPTEFQDLVNHINITNKLRLPEKKKKTGPGESCVCPSTVEVLGAVDRTHVWGVAALLGRSTWILVGCESWIVYFHFVPPGILSDVTSYQ